MNTHLAAKAVAAAGITLLVRREVGDYGSAGIAITNNTANALDAFEIRGKMSDNGPEVTLASSLGDFTGPVFPIIRADDMTTLAGNSSGVMFIDLTGLKSLSLWASGAAATDVDIDINLSHGSSASAGGAGGGGASEDHIGQIGGHTVVVNASFSRPADTTAYASGDLVANSTTAGSVVPMPFAVAREPGAGGMLRRARIRKTGTSITNASFRLHFYRVSPTPSNGDNGVWLTNQADDYVGSMDVSVDRAFTDGAAGNGVPNVGSEINFTADTYYVLMEARGAYAPVSGETFTVELEVIQN